jgi:hypothetical protein
MHLAKGSGKAGVRTIRFVALGCLAVLVCGAAGAASPPLPPFGPLPTDQGTAPTAIVRQLGTIKQIQGNNIKLTNDDGTDINIVVKLGARMLRVEPGEKDLTHAVPLELSDLQTGDRIRVRGQNTPDGKTLVALEVIAIKHLDIQAKRQQEQADWQKRGIGGLVSAVDPAASTISVSVRAAGASKTVRLHVTPSTILRRYAAGSVRFDDAKPAPIGEIHAGDQLRARGSRSESGDDFAAEEVVSGSFRNIAGTINSIDPEAKTLSIADLLSKKPVTVQISAQSQLRKLSPEMAAGLAARLRSPVAGPVPAGGSAAAGSGAASGGQAGPGGASGGAPGGAPRGDFQQLVNRLPLVTLADLQKGDAVILVATENGDSAPVTAITLLGGVEALLTASARGSQQFTLSPWSLGGGGGGEGAGEPNQ